MSQSQSQTISLPSLPPSQLRQLKSQLDTELEHLTTSHQRLRLAQGRFRECVKCLNASDGEGGARVRGVGTSKDGGVSSKEEESGDARTVLVPLTGSLYVPGRLIGGENEGKVLVDVGTGFYVEKTRSEAAVFYKEKVDGIEANLKDLEKIVQGKSGNVRVVEEVLRQKMMSSKSNSTPTTT